jgi:Tol biopolymer transport system component
MSPGVGACLGPYEVVALIGAGGMGEVYRARDTRLKRDVALKVLPAAFAADPDRLARFQREAEVLASLNHPGIAAIYGIESTPSGTALVLELVEGDTLAERIVRGALPLDEALPIAKQIAEALEAAHEQGIIHRDLKPANVKLRPDGTVKVLDFGLAKLQSEAAVTSSAALSLSPTITSPAQMTGVGVLLGTAAYMSPEQARGKPADKRSDIWAFGCVLYEMLTGRRPFDGAEVTDIVARVLERTVEWSVLPQHTPPRIRRLLQRCLTKDLRQRLQAIGEARIALEAPDAIESAPPGRARSLMLVAAALVAGIGAGALSGVAYIRSQARPTLQPMLRYSIQLPKDGLFLSHAVSPDGRFILVSDVVDATAVMLVRALDGSEFRRLPAADHGYAPLWSPDSRFIAFVTGNALNKVSVDGGPAETLATLPSSSFLGGSWGLDAILIAVENGRLMSVPATGGEARTLLEAEPGVSLRYPHFLPNDTHYLYTRVGQSGGGVYLASLAEPRGRQLLADQSSAIFVRSRTRSESGWLIFVRDGKLMAQAFDAGARQLSGTAAVLADRVLLADNGAAAVSVSETGIMAALGGASRRANSRLAWFDAAGKLVEHHGGAGADSPFAISPDGRTAAVLRHVNSFTGDLWLRELARGTESRFTSTSAVGPSPVWAPDGRRVAFTAKHQGTWFDLYWKDLLGTEAAVLQTSSDKYVSDWSPDGRLLLYSEIDPKTQSDVLYVPVDGPSRTPVPFARSEFNESSGRFSPDGRWIAYVSDESGRFEVYVRPFPSGAGTWRISPDGGAQPQWSRDGKELFYLSGPTLLKTLRSVAIRTNGGVFDADTPKPVFEARINDWHPTNNSLFYALSLNGRRFLINYLEGDAESVLNVVTNWTPPDQGR